MMTKNLEELVDSGKYGAFIVQTGDSLHKIHPSRITGFAFGQGDERKTLYVVLPSIVISGHTLEVQEKGIELEKLFEDVKEFKTKVASLTPKEAVNQLTKLLKGKNYLPIQSSDYPNELFMRPSYKSIDALMSSKGYSEEVDVFANE